MATKIVLAVSAIIALALTGTIGVAYYNDPTLFDSLSGAPTAVSSPCAASAGSTASDCSVSDQCESSAAHECEK